MKIYSKGRSEIIEQAWRRSFHMWFDLDIEPRGVSMEADLSLPTKSNRKISMMTSFNEELYNAAWDFLSKVKIYDSEMHEFTDDMLVTVVTRMIHKTIERLNEKGEPLWNVFVKTPKAKSRELELAKEEYLGKSTIKQEVNINVDDNILVEEKEEDKPKKATKKNTTNKSETKKKWDANRVKSFSKLEPNAIKKPVREKKENPFYNDKQVF